MKTRKSFYTSILLVIGAIVLANVLSVDFFTRIDLTENHSYTLSKASKAVVANLEDPITIKAYFSENLPPNVAQVRQDFKDLLIEYANLSNGNLVYEFINPNGDENLEQEATKSGINAVMINVREKDEVKQQKAYMGAVIEQADRLDVIPFLQPGEAMEYALTTSIKKVTVVDKPSIALLQGHGEPSMEDMQQVTQSVNVLYNFEPISLVDLEAIPTRFKTVAIIAPKDTITSNQLAKLDTYLSNGGQLLIAINRVKGDLQNASGTAVYTGLESWLQQKRIIIDDKFLIDTKSASINVQQQQGTFRISSQVQFPYLPIINNFSDHPISKGLEAMLLPFASPITYTGDSTIHYQPLAFTSAQSGTVSVPTYFDIQRQWTTSDFPLGKQVVAAAFSGTIVSGSESKMVVIGDGDFAVNNQGEGQQPQALQPDNLSFFINSIDWLSDDTGLIDLRTKAVTSRPLDQLEDGTRSLLKYLNFFLPMLLVIIYGLFRMQLKRRIRVKRMEVSYE